MSNAIKEKRLAYRPDLIRALGQYLLQRPMVEVRSLVEALESQGVEVEVSFEPAPVPPVEAAAPAVG